MSLNLIVGMCVAMKLKPLLGQTMTKLLIGLLFSCFSINAVSSPPIDRTSFGLHVRFVYRQAPGATDFSVWPWINFGAIRTWNSYTGWVDVEKQRGEFDFSKLDDLVDRSVSDGVDILLTLGRTPRWASARPNEDCGYSLGCAAEPANIDDWRMYVSTLVERYKGRVFAYEVWNEPAFSEIEPVLNTNGRAKQYFTGSADQMVVLAREAYKVIKAIDPRIRVVSPSVTSEANGVRRLEEFVRRGGGEYVDVWGYHFYLNSPEDVVSEVTRLRRMLEKYGVGAKPVWNTESGYVWSENVRSRLGASGRELGWSSPRSVEEVAELLARTFVLQLNLGVQRVYWFNWDHALPGDSMGISPNGVELSSIGRAYSRVRSWLVGTVPLGCQEKASGVWVCDIARNKKRFRVVWSVRGEYVYLNDGFSDVEMLLGSRKHSRGLNLKVGSAPVLLVY